MTGASAGRCGLSCAAMKVACEHMANGVSEDKSCVPDKCRVSLTHISADGLNVVMSFRTKKIFWPLFLHFREKSLYQEISENPVMS